VATRLKALIRQKKKLTKQFTRNALKRRDGKRKSKESLNN
jgi:hypothetical protein